MIAVFDKEDYSLLGIVCSMDGKEVDRNEVEAIIEKIKDLYPSSYDTELLKYALKEKGLYLEEVAEVDF